tara:strand:- start:2755 stop:3051 length:297 start_codon:yes stop_codon:yes gene_type:complete
MENFEVKTTHTTIKEYAAKDLPLYFKWELGANPWFYRVRLREGKIVSDLIKKSTEGYEFSYSTVQSAFDPSNVKIDQDEWRNEMHSFIKQMSVYSEKS